MIKKTIWLVFIFLIVFTGWQEIILVRSSTQHYSMFGLQLASRPQAKVILSAWAGHQYGVGRMTDLAESITRWDFLFLVCYVLLIITESSDQMQQEKSLRLNKLLRLNLLLAVLAGMLNVYGDFLQLHNFRHVVDEQFYLRTCWVSYPKFLVAGWALLVWLISIVKNLFNTT